MSDRPLMESALVRHNSTRPMMEVLSESVRLVNLPFTILLALVILYWLLMSVGLIDFDSNVDMDLDLDADADLDLDTDAEADGGIETGWFSSVLQFLNIGEVPMMVILSIMALSSWLVALALNHYWNNGSLLWGAIFLIPNLVITCVVTHFVSKPFKGLFKALNREYDEHLPIVGRTCTVTTSEANQEFGQASIATKGAPILINVRTPEDAVLAKGETGLVIKEDRQKSICTIIKVTAPKLEA